MYSTLEFDLRPGSGVGIFELGTSLWSILDQLRHQQHLYPQVDVKFDPDSPATTPIILHVRPHLDLLFSPYHQRLHTICIRRLREETHPPLVLRYNTAVISSGEMTLRRVGVSRTFGPTYAGEDLRYPGVWFSFEDDGRGDGHGLKVAGATDDRRQEVKKIIVCEKGFDGEHRDAMDEVHECSVMFGDITRALVKIHEGITLRLHPASAEPLQIRIGTTTAQDLACDLGPPLRIHYKEDDRMKIHSHGTSSESDDEGDYFYNYFNHGIDFMISGASHTVKKIILHTNIPGTPMFQRYKRCPWEIEGMPEDDEDDSPPCMRFYDSFDQINHFLRPDEPPTSMVLDRTDEEDGLTLPNSTSRLMGYDGIILEVADSNLVTAVTLF